MHQLNSTFSKLNIYHTHYTNHHTIPTNTLNTTTQTNKNLTCPLNCFKNRKLLPYGSAGVNNCTKIEVPIVRDVDSRIGDKLSEDEERDGNVNGAIV